MSSIKILGTGMYVPEKVVTNDDFTAFVETSDEWIRTRTGMENRHIATTEPTWLMGLHAAENAMKDAAMDPKDIDMIIVTTVSSDFFTPSTACIIQQKLGIEDACAVDINVACTGLAFATNMARNYLAVGDATNVLIISAESLSQVTNYEDRTTCVLFADGAGACILTKGDGLYGSFQKADISGTHHIYGKFPRKTHPLNDVTETEEPFPIAWENKIYMNGREVYKFATKAMPKAIIAAAEKAGIDYHEINCIVPHQANARIIETAAKNLDLDLDKLLINIHKYGNTSSASEAIGLHEAIKSGKIKRGDIVCLVGFGAGLTYGATLFTY